MKHKQPSSILRLLVLTMIVAVTASACASHKFVRKEDRKTQDQVDELNRDVDRTMGEVDELGKEVDAVSHTAQEALERAIAAGELADGKFLYETVLTDEAVKFGFDEATLSEAGYAALDDFANHIKDNNENVYIEIQGHTDNTGAEDYNLKLGHERATAVREYLSMRHGFALHRMNVISYGETAPTMDNSTSENRAQNRRVALVVLK